MGYKKSITAIKGAQPLGVIVVAEGISAILQACKVEVPKEQLYPACVFLYGVLVAGMNWFKHRKPKVVEPVAPTNK